MCARMSFNCFAERGCLASLGGVRTLGFDQPPRSGGAGRRSDATAVPSAKRGMSGVAANNPSLSANNRLSYGGSRLHLRDDLPRTPSGPEGSSGRGIKSGAEVLLARVDSCKLAAMSYGVLARKWRPKRL